MSILLKCSIIRNNIHLAIKDSLDTSLVKICAKYKKSKSHKLKQTFLNPMKIFIIIIYRFDNNNRKLNNVMCITESMNIDSYQANLKDFIKLLKMGNTL